MKMLKEITKNSVEYKDEVPESIRIKSEEVKKIWNQYQEQPGLLDSHVSSMVDIIIGTFSKSVVRTVENIL